MSDPNLYISNMLGAVLLGFAVSCVVFGVSTDQAVTYFHRFPEDWFLYKFLVALVWALELVDQVFIGQAVYFYFIDNYEQPEVLLTQRVAWTLILQLTVGAVIGMIVRICFATRVWLFSERNVIVTGTIVIFTLGEMGVAILYTIRCLQKPYVIFLPDLKLVASVALGINAATDLFTAGALCYFLRKFRTGLQESDSLVNTLTIYAVNNGVLTAVIGICTIIFYDVHPKRFQFLAFYFILTKLYAISFFCTLNARRVIRGKGTEHSSTKRISQTELSESPSSATLHCHRGANLENGVNQEVSQVDDGNSGPYAY
ncbi:hypothetical protein GGX14DRAFT_546699 [Mycena pura]|uniref:DUF6534 domain-containing protein n=1 Tax=Mycena pura TaxID=153505 RepID=A0AAD6UNG9_9AGAR|nr:hypothetical protein GGX14DRAFT_546699 [Mycena pura]